MHNLMENNINDTKLLVSALENGTVLDHIPAEVVYKALDILNLKGVDNRITIGINLSRKASSRLPTNFSKMSS